MSNPQAGVINIATQNARVGTSFSTVPIIGSANLNGITLNGDNTFSFANNDTVVLDLHILVGAIGDNKNFRIHVYDMTAASEVAGLDSIADGGSVTNGQSACFSFPVIAGHSYAIRAKGVGAGDPLNMITIQQGSIYVRTIVSSAGGGGGGVSFDKITTGENTTATMTVGSGCTMNVDLGGNFGISSVEPTCVVVGGTPAPNLTAGAFNNTIIGTNSPGATLVGGVNNTIIGNAADLCSDCNDATVVGQQSYANTNGVTIGQGSGRHTASGTNNTIVGFNSATAMTTAASNVFIGSSVATALQSGSSNVAIGASVALGGVTASNAVVIGNAAFASDSAVVIGNAAGKSGMSAPRLTLIGNGAGTALTSAPDETIIGYQAGTSIANSVGGGANVIVGSQAAQSTTFGTHNVIIGKSANTAGGNINDSVAIGYTSICPDGGAVLIGSGTGNATISAANLVSIGYHTASALTSGGDNTFVGYQSGLAVVTGQQNTFIGSNSAGAVTGSSNTALGYNSMSLSNAGSFNTCIGAVGGPAVGTGANTVVVGYDAWSPSGGVVIGYLAGATASTGAGMVIIGNAAGNAITSDSNTVMIGASATARATTANSVIIGHSAAAADSSVVIGASAGTNAASTDNVFIGYQTGNAVTVNSQVFIGSGAGQASTSGTQNTYIGFQAGNSAAAANDANGTCIGWRAGAFLNSSGGGNTLIGAATGTAVSGGANLVTGNSNTFIGANTAANASGTANAIIIGSASRAASSSIIIGTSKTSATTNDFIIESGDVGLRRVAAKVMQATDGAGTGAWFQNTAGSARVTAQFDKAANTTLAGVTGLSVSLQAGRSYSFLIIMHCTLDATGGAKVDLNGGSATVTTFNAHVEALGTTVVNTSIHYTSLNFGGSPYTVANANTTTGVKFTITGTITVNAAGTFQPEFAQNAASGTSSVLVGSYMWVWDMP